MRNAASRFGAALSFALLGAALFAGSASAAFLHSTASGSFGPDGTEGSTFSYSNISLLAVDDANRHLYALEDDGESGGNQGLTLYGFDLNNPFQSLGGVFPEPTLFGDDRGELDGNVKQGLAVDNTGLASAGNIYVSVAKANTAGKLFAFNPSGGNLGGEYPEVIPEPKKSCGVAVDSKGHIWIADQLGDTLDEYSADGVPLGRSISLGGLTGSECAFVFNPVNDDVYVYGRINNPSFLWKFSAASDYKQITEFPPSDAFAFDAKHQVLYIAGGGIRAYNTDGFLIDQFASGTGVSNIAVDEETGTVYASTLEYPTNRIYAYPPTGILPDATPGDVTGTTVHASVDPAGGGNIEECVFEYGTTALYDGTYESSQPCEQATPYASSTEVSATLPGLTTEVLYHYRVKVANAAGDNVSTDRTFVPHNVVDLKTQPATGLTKTTATLEGSYTGTNDDTHFYFEWGPTIAYGNKTSTPPGEDDGTATGPRTLSAPISGLQAGGTYYYRVVASNSQGTSASEDRTFTTPPAVTDLSASITNLTGSSATLNGAWTGDGTDTHFYFEWGGTTVYGHTTAVPPGEDAGSGTGLEQVHVDLPELLPTSRYHYRLVATNSSGTTMTPDASFRTPQLAAVSYSPVLKITTGSAELIGSVNPQKTGATTYHFEYGTDKTYGESTPESASVGSDESFHPATAVIDGLSPGTTYHYRIVATSPTGTARGADQKFNTIPNLPTVTSSSANNLVIGEITLHAGVRPGFGSTVVYFVYGPTTGYGKATIPVGPLPGDDTEHDVTTLVGNLIANTVYHYRVVAVNFAGVSYGPDETFETPGLPEVGAASASNISKSGATLGGQVNPRHTDTTYSFEYGVTPAYGASVGARGSVGSDAVFHSVSASVGGLAPGTTYHFRLVATNALGSAAGPDQSFTTAAEPSVRTTPPPPRVPCKKGQVRKHGKCVKKPHKRHRRHHARRKG